MNARRVLLPILIVTMIGGLPAGCGEAPSKDYGWFAYAAPEGWARYEPPPGITYAPTLVMFRPPDPETGSGLRLEIRDVTDEKSRIERNALLFARAREAEWRARCSQAEQKGDPMPAFECTSVTPSIGGPGEKEGLSILIERDGKQSRKLVHFVELSDSRLFRADYIGADPEFAEHHPAITASLQTLEFAPPAPSRSPLTREETVASLAEHLDDERLWLYDGEVAGRRLNDEHLEAMTDPTFAEVTDLNLISGHAAMMTGIDVTDAGLEHTTHMRLRSLCLRGSLVTDAGLAYLKDMPLETLVLEGTLIEGAGLRHLSGLRLKAIDLANTPVDDDDLKHLAGMPLISVNLRNTRVTDAGLAELQRQIPELLVSY